MENSLEKDGILSNAEETLFSRMSDRTRRAAKKNTDEMTRDSCEWVVLGWSRTINVIRKQR
jgi:hypothetical protein